MTVGNLPLKRDKMRIEGILNPIPSQSFRNSCCRFGSGTFQTRAESLALRPRSCGKTRRGRLSQLAGMGKPFVKRFGEARTQPHPRLGSRPNTWTMSIIWWRVSCFHLPTRGGNSSFPSDSLLFLQCFQSWGSHSKSLRSIFLFDISPQKIPLWNYRPQVPQLSPL